MESEKINKIKQRRIETGIFVGSLALNEAPAHNRSGIPTPIYTFATVVIADSP